MFINDIHIFWYVGIGILGLLIGRFLGLVNTNLPEHKKIFSMPIIKDYIKNTNTDYIMMIVISVLYILLLLAIGIEDKLKLIQFLLLTPMLVSAFCIDYKLQIIPNRLTLTMFETGIVFSFLRGLNNLNVAVEMWLGMIFGAGIFIILTFLGNIVLKKETMGFGDVKLMGALGLFFGWRNIIAISILSFFMLQFFNVVGYSIDITFITLSSIKLFNLSSKLHHNLDVHLSISNQFHKYHALNMRTLLILVSLTQSLCL